MNAQTIMDDLVDSLRAHHPFEEMDRDDLIPLCAATEIQYLNAGYTIFTQGEQPGERVWFIYRGSVTLTRRLHRDGELTLDHICDEGDVFGLRAQLNEAPYSATAVTAEGTLLYALPWPALRDLIHAHAPLALYFASSFAAELPEASARLMDLESAWGAGGRRGCPDVAERPVKMSRDVLTCPPTLTLQNAARQMAIRNVGSIIVTDMERRPLGIVTDADLRKRVVAHGIDATRTSVEQVMSHPVITLREGEPTPLLLARMMRQRVHHLCITADGTPTSPVIGVISEHDLLAARGRHPLILVDELERAADEARLRALRDQAEDRLKTWLAEKRSMRFIAGVISEINDGVVRRAIALALEAMGPPPRRFCWLALGSEGREEQLLRTDQDNAIVYADGPEDGAREGEAIHRWFVALGERVCGTLEAAGYRKCPGDLMASNPEMTRPLAHWRARFTGWTQAPDPQALMRANIFFDLRPIVGASPHEDEALGDALRDHTLRAVGSARGFLPFFAHSALSSPPPLSLFRRVIVERSGAHRRTFDLKARAMAPLADAARVLVYDLGIPIYGTTAERYEAIATATPELADLARDGADAYELWMRHRALEGLARGSSGSHLDLGALSRLQQHALRNTFEVIQRLQHHLETRYRAQLIR